MYVFRVHQKLEVPFLRVEEWQTIQTGTPKTFYKDFKLIKQLWSKRFSLYELNQIFSYRVAVNVCVHCVEKCGHYFLFCENRDVVKNFQQEWHWLLDSLFPQGFQSTPTFSGPIRNYNNIQWAIVLETHRKSCFIFWFK